MKNIILCGLCLLAMNSYAQLDTIITNLNDPYGVAIYENYLYTAESSVANTIRTYRLVRIDLDKPWLGTQLVIDGIQGMSRDIEVIGPYLYFHGSVYKNTYIGLQRVDLRQRLPQAVRFGEYLGSNVKDLAKDGKYLYATVSSAGRIKRLNTKLPSPEIEEFNATCQSANMGVAIGKGVAYYTLYNTRGFGCNPIISKLPLVKPYQPEFLIQTAHTSTGLELYGDDLYFVELSNVVSKIDITDEQPVKTEVFTDLDIDEIEIHNHFLYLVDRNNGMIFRHELEKTTSIPTTPTKVKPTIFPNPTSGGLCFRDLHENTVCRVYDSKGLKVIEREILNTTHPLMDISHLPAGIYYIALEKIGTFKVVKN